MVHKDEKTPHMHVGMVPVTKDGELSAKQFLEKEVNYNLYKRISLRTGREVSDNKYMNMQEFNCKTLMEKISQK